jgi:TolA-binding protein
LVVSPAVGSMLPRCGHCPAHLHHRPPSFIATGRLFLEDPMHQRLSLSGRVFATLVVLAACLSLVAPAGAQDTRQGSAQPTRNDIQRLQDSVYDVGTDIGRLRAYEATRADEFQARLDDLREEVIYLKVKQRKDGVSRSEFSTLRNQLDDLRGQVRSALPASAADTQGNYGNQPGQTRGDNRYPPASAGTRPSTDRDRDDASANRPARQGTTGRADEVPAGTEIDVRLENAISSDTAQVEDRFTATTVADLYNGNRVLIPAGSAVRGVVTSVNKAGRVERTGKLTLAFDRVTVGGRSYPMHGTVEQALESGGYRQDAGKIGAGAGVGAIIGGILGGMKGALAGILIGGGGVVAATEGQDVNLPAGTVLRIRLDSPVTVR